MEQASAWWHLRLRARRATGMVGDQAPADCGSLKHVGGNYPSMPGVAVDFDPHTFHDAVQGQTRACQAPDLAGFQIYPTLCQHGGETVSNRGQPDEPGPSGMHTHHLIVVAPAGHDGVQIALPQGVVERRLDGSGAFGFARGFQACCDHGDERIRRKGGRRRQPLAPPLVKNQNLPRYSTPFHSEKRMRKTVLTIAVLAGLSLSGCGYNDFQRLDEQTKSAWSEVLNQYQRRADLVPNIVATVKGEAAFEQDTLTQVVQARARATAIQVTPETLNNPEALKRFQAAQGELGSALSRLMVVSERYPDLKANQGFRDLRVQLEGTENRITVARNRYIQTVQEYNVLARSFPTNLTAMVFGYRTKEGLTVANEAQISAPPTVDFSKKP